MSVNGLSVGRDYSLGFYDSNTATVVDLGDVQSVKITKSSHNIQSNPYNGPPKFGFIPAGYSISFSITRTGPDLEAFQLAADNAFDAGTISKAGYLYETITEPDGTISKYQYTGFVFDLEDLGDISRDKVITQSAKGFASTKVKMT